MPEIRFTVLGVENKSSKKAKHKKHEQNDAITFVKDHKQLMLWYVKRQNDGDGLSQ